MSQPFQAGHIHSHTFGALLARPLAPLAWALAVVLVFMVVEMVGALVSGSLALLADVGHMTSDATALGLALFASWLSRRPHTPKRTYGHFRVEVLVALVNGLTLLAIVGYIFWLAAQRFASPPEVQGGTVIVVATLGLLANGVAWFILARGSRENINVRGALWHLAGDALGSAGAILSGVLLVVFGWLLADPIISVVIGSIIMVGGYRLVRDSLRVLMESAPANVDMTALQRAIEAFDAVKQVHDIHLWSITPGYEAMSAHVVLTPDCSQQQSRLLLEHLRSLLAEEFGVGHMTVQLEGEDADCVEAHVPGVTKGLG